MLCVYACVCGVVWYAWCMHVHMGVCGMHVCMLYRMCGVCVHVYVWCMCAYVVCVVFYGMCGVCVCVYVVCGVVWYVWCMRVCVCVCVCVSVWYAMELKNCCHLCKLQLYMHWL